MAPHHWGNASETSAIETSIISIVQHIPLYRNEFFLREKYLEERLSTRQIAEQIFSARSTVIKYLKTYKIPLRSEDKAHELNKGQCAFGERMVDGLIVPHLRELAVIRQMQRLRSKGHSYWRIAAYLNTKDIPTKNRTRWHATTVMKILKSALGHNPD